MATKSQARTTIEKLLVRASDNAGMFREQAAVGTGRILVRAAGSMREVSQDLASEVGDHADQARRLLSLHVAHEIVAGFRGKPAHPDSHIARQDGLLNAAQAMIKLVVSESLPYVADAAEAVGQRLAPEAPRQELPTTLPPVSEN